uniref:Uncharacterized protein n=1 Tax=Canis lupus familiaris TaxID=9615 RepID=A0A8C0PJK3_CANLF
MSAPDEVSVRGAGFGPEGGEQASGAPRGPGLGLDPGPPRSGEGEGGFPDPEGFESEREVMEAGGPVLWGREGRPGTPADDKGDALDYASHLADESGAASVQQLTDPDALGVRRNPSPESCAAEGSGVWAGLEAGPGGRGALALSRGESQPPSAVPLHLGGPEGARPRGNPRRGPKSRSTVRVDRQRPSAKGPGRRPSDPESSDEFGEIQLMRVSICSKERGQAKPNSPEDPGDTPRQPSFHVRENFLHVPGSFLSSAPRGFTSVVERQAVGELDISSSKKMQSVVWGKGGNRPSYPVAAAAAKVAQEKKSLGGASKVTQGRSFPPWGQRVSAAPLEPATFPPISGVPLLGRNKRYSLVPSGSKQSKHTGRSRKKSGPRRTRESEPVVVTGEGSDSNRDTVPKGQLPTHRPGPCCSGMHRGECSSGDLDTRAPEVPGSSAPSSCLATLRILGAACGCSSGDQEPLDHLPRPERLQQPPGTQGCPRCLLTPVSVSAAMQSLTDKFQTL